jgi:hypothetical protein
MRLDLTFGTLFRRKRRAAAWLALFALVMQTLVPLGQMLQAAESESTIYICTSTGIMPLHQGLPSVDPLSDPGADRDIAACDVCTAGLFGQSVLAPVADFVALVKGRTVGDVPSSSGWLDRRPVLMLSVRGPPHLV